EWKSSTWASIRSTYRRPTVGRPALRRRFAPDPPGRSAPRPTRSLLAMAAPTLDGAPRSLDPRIRTVWRIGELTGAVIVGGAAVVAAVLTHAPGWLLAAAGGLAAVLVARAIVWPGLAWRCWRWSAWPDAIELRHG